MFKLEKVFQNDDTGYYFFINIIKSFALIVSIYIFSILEKNSIHELLNFQLFINSKYYLYSILVSSFYFILSFFFKKKEYKKNLKSFIENDIYNIVIIHILIFFIFFIFNINFQINNSTFYLFLYLIIILILLKLYFNYLYDRLIEENIIQKNIMVVGSYNEIKKILNEKFDNIVIFKCCLITDFNNQNLRLIKSEFKFPIFNQNEDIRSILEYHSLGQIWVINAEDKEKEKAFNKIIQFSVDTLNIKLENSDQSTNKKLLFNKFEYEFYEYSKFFGVNLFIKILIDKILAFIFLIVAAPILIISGIAIYLEDGFPIIFTQNRTGWDGRRFKVYKLRSLFNEKYNVTSQITKDDSRKLRIGKFIRKYSIDELPQLYNVLKGEMSLVGPRPHPVMLDLQYSNIYKSFLTRYRCNPGLTGWAQVNGLRGATPNPESMKRRMEFDLWYLNNWSIVLDIYIILKTFYAIIRYKGE
jgi:exopolysaccharide biosynthesis polyprenyl glycosylphosphotransferase